MALCPPAPAGIISLSLSGASSSSRAPSQQAAAQTNKQTNKQLTHLGAGGRFSGKPPRKLRERRVGIFAAEEVAAGFFLKDGAHLRRVGGAS